MNHKTSIPNYGKTQDGKVIVTDVFRFYEQDGLPLDIVLSIFKERNWIPSWIDLYRDAWLAGMDHNRIISWLSPAVMDVYGINFHDVVIVALEKLYGLNIHSMSHDVVTRATIVAANGSCSLPSAVMDELKTNGRPIS